MKTESAQRYILMSRDDEVLSFSFDFATKKFEFLAKLAHFEKAPFAMKKENADLCYELYDFFKGRSITEHRHGYKQILEATGCKDTLELIFQGHGLSLSNHFWFKKEGESLSYKDINFFEHPWDDRFGRALLNDDFDALKDCSYEVPDILTQGWAIKGWIYDHGPKLYKLGIQKGHAEESLSEVLTSSLARRMFASDEVVSYELKQWNEEYASSCSPMITIDEELVHLSEILPPRLADLYSEKSKSRKAAKEFFHAIKEEGIDGLEELFIKLSCLRSLCFIGDLHFDNIAMIRNINTGELRPAPFFDLAGAFGSTKSGQEFLSKPNQGSLLIVYFFFGNLDPEWDYSWYDPRRLEGFEDEIRATLSKSPFYSPSLIDTIIDVYSHQKKALDKLSKK